MNKTLWIAASGMSAQQLKTDTIDNNIANASTNAYKKGNAHFKDMLYDTLVTPGAATNGASELPVGVQVGSGVDVGAVSRQFSQGNGVASSSPLDLMIQGEGFFQVLLSDGTNALTRDGNLYMNQNGQVVTSEGYQVVGFPNLNPQGLNITITEDGTVSQTVNGTTNAIGRLQIAKVANPEGLQSLGGNLYLPTIASGDAQLGNPAVNDYGSVNQYQLEGSNVDIVKEMVDLIAAQRAYELNSKAIKSADQMLQQIASLK